MIKIDKHRNFGILFIISCFLMSSAYATQITELKGTWITQENYVIAFHSLKERTATIESNSDKNFVNFTYSDGILNFSYEILDLGGYEKPSEHLKTKTYSFRVEKLTRRKLILIPVSDLSKRFFNSSERIVFENQQYLKDENLKFEKLIFDLGKCLYNTGCPRITLEVKNDKSFRYDFRKRFYASGETDKSGHYKGKLSSKSYKELIELIIKSKLISLNPEVKKIYQLGHRPIKTFVVHHNHQKKVLRTQFQSVLLDDLIYFLSNIDKKASSITKVASKREWGQSIRID